MKRILCGVLVLSSTWAWGLSGEAVAGSQAVAPSPNWYASLNALYLSRSTPSGAKSIVGNNPYTGTSFLAPSDLQFPANVGIDATVGVHVFDRSALEATLMASKFNGSHTMISPGGFIGVGFTGPGGTKFVSDFDTTFASAEVNWRQTLNDHVDVLIGLRALNIADVLDTQINTTVARGRYDTGNALLGAQIGAELSAFDNSSPFQISLSGKIGMYQNQSYNQIQEYSGAAQTFIGAFRSGNTFAGSVVADVALTAEYKISKAVALTAGYQAIWANNLALASDAASNSLLNPSLLKTHVYRDDLWMHGVSVGMRITF